MLYYLRVSRGERNERPFTFDACSEAFLRIYLHGRRKLGQKVFSRPGAAAAVKDEEMGWRESLYRVYKSGQARPPLYHACSCL